MGATRSPALRAVGESIGRFYGLWIVLTAGLSVGLMLLSLRLAPFEMFTPDFSPSSSELAAREDARLQAYHGMAQLSDEEQDQQAYNFGRFMIIFRARDDGQLLTPDTIARVKQIEDAVLALDGFTSLCHHGADNPGACEMPGSVLDFLYPSKRSLGGSTVITVPDRQGALVERPAEATFNATAAADWLLQLLPTSQACVEPPHTCSMVRSVFSLGGPLEGYRNLQDRKAEQRHIRYEFLARLAGDLLWPILHNESEPVRIAFSGDEVWRYELNIYMTRDAMMTTGSMTLLLAYFWFHTGSLALALAGITNLGLAFPFSYFVYRTCFGFRVNGLTVMAMFVVLGIGADNVFIIVDAWKRSQSGPTAGGLGAGAGLAERAAFVLQFAAPAMALTSITTISAFMTSALSLIPVIRLFGLFAALVVGTNFVLVCTFFLACVCAWDQHVRPCCARVWPLGGGGGGGAARAREGAVGGNGHAHVHPGRPASHPAPKPAPLVLHAKSSPLRAIAGCKFGWPGRRPTSAGSPTIIAGTAAPPSFNEFHSAPSSTTGDEAGSDALDAAAAAQSPAPRRRPMEAFFHDVYVPFADRHRRLLLLLFTLIVVLCAFIGARFKLEDTASEMLPADSNLVKFKTWNNDFPMTAGISATRVHFLWGVVGIDRTRMDASDPEDHGAVLLDHRFDLWRDQAALAAFCDALKQPPLVQYTENGGAECAVTLFRDYRLFRNQSFPIRSRSLFYDRFAAYLATPEGYPFKRWVGFDDDGLSVSWVDVPIVSSLLPTQHGAIVEKHFEFWEEVADGINAAGNFTAAVVQSSDAWKQMVTLQSLAKTALYGMLCSLAFATACMLVATQQWRLTAFATLTITCIVITLVAAYVLMGRSLGFMESVNLAIVSGLAVDYTLHIAHLYQHSDHTTRFERVQESLGIIGISISSGAITTLLASSMLFAAYIKMSQAFGATIFLSIAFSYVYAIGLFVPLLLEFGPLPNSSDEQRAREESHRWHDGWGKEREGDTESMLGGERKVSFQVRGMRCTCSPSAQHTMLRASVAVAAVVVVVLLVVYAIDPAR